MWSFCRSGGSGTEQPSSDAMAARDALPVLRGPLFLWRATPISFSGREREMGLHKRADEYPRGAGRICNAPSSRTAALGIGSYMVQWKNVRRAGEVLRPYMQNRLRGAKSPLDSGNSVCLF